MTALTDQGWVGCPAGTSASSLVMPPMPVGIQPDGRKLHQADGGRANWCGSQWLLVLQLFVEAVNKTGKADGWRHPV